MFSGWLIANGGGGVEDVADVGAEVGGVLVEGEFAADFAADDVVAFAVGVYAYFFAVET